MKKQAILTVVGIAVALFAVSILKNVATGTAISTTLSQVMHASVKLGKTNISFAKAAIKLENIQISNPSGFPAGVMVDVPLVAIDFQPAELLQKKIHFGNVALDLKELVVVKNKAGEINLNALKPKEDAKDKEKKPTKSDYKLQIDRLDLSIGKVVYMDYSGGGEPKVQTFDINIKNREFKNISNPTAMVSVIMMEALTRTTLSKITNLDVGFLKDQAGDVLSGSLGLVGDGADKVQSTAKSLLKLF